MGDDGDSVRVRFIEAVRGQETGNLKDPFIRTKINSGAGSSAYGPYQTTKGLVDSALANDLYGFDAAEKAVMSKLSSQQDTALKIGGGDRKKYEEYFTKEQLDRFDYGGTYNFSELEKAKIESAQLKMVNKTLDDADGDLEEAAKVWHGGGNHGDRKDHVEYSESVMKRLDKKRPRGSNVDKSIEGNRTLR
jgi:hypothetical protein